MVSKNIMQDCQYGEPAKIKEEIGTLKLSSESIANEQENVSKYMNFSNGHFAYLRLGKTSGSIRFYPDSQTAYSETVKEYGSLLLQGVTGSRASFYISDSNDNIVYEGEPKMNGKIHFSIYDGNCTTQTVSLADPYEYYDTTLSTKQNESMEEITELIETPLDASTGNSFEEGIHADDIRKNASVFMEKDILTQDNINFLCLSEDSAHDLAKRVQDAAIINKNADNETFTRAIQDVSLNMITVTKQLANGKPTDKEHCSMHDDRLYLSSHSNPGYLFSGSNMWKRTPGKLDFYKLEDAIMDMYNKGREMILDVSCGSQKENASVEIPVADDAIVQETSITETPIIQESTTTTCERRSFNDAVLAITSTVMTYTTSSEDVLFYLRLKGTSLESEIKSLTNNVVMTSVKGDQIFFKTLSGISKELNIRDYADNDTLRDGVRTIIKQLIICAALSDKTRDSIATFVDVDSIVNYVSSQPKMAA